MMPLASKSTLLKLEVAAAVCLASAGALAADEKKPAADGIKDQIVARQK